MSWQTTASQVAKWIGIVILATGLLLAALLIGVVVWDWVDMTLAKV